MALEGSSERVNPGLFLWGGEHFERRAAAPLQLLAFGSSGTLQPSSPAFWLVIGEHPWAYVLLGLLCPCERQWQCPVGSGTGERVMDDMSNSCCRTATLLQLTSTPRLAITAKNRHVLV